MPALGDYFGYLLAEITNARVQADLETVRIAQLYASHPMLQHMPVPRFRLPNVTLDMPVGVDKVDSPADVPDVAETKKKTTQLIEDTLRLEKVEIKKALWSHLRRSLDDLFGGLEAIESRNPLALGAASERALHVVLDAMPTEEDTTLRRRVESSLRPDLALEFSKLQPRQSKVQVLVNTSELKDLGPHQNLTRIQLNISEQGVEWMQPNPSDPSSKRLVPE